MNVFSIFSMGNYRLSSSKCRIQELQNPVILGYGHWKISFLLLSPLGLPCWLRGKESACNAGGVGDVGSVSGLGSSPGGGHGNPMPVFLSGESHGQKSLADYSPWGCKESDTTDALSTHAHAHTCPRAHMPTRTHIAPLA